MTTAETLRDLARRVRNLVRLVDKPEAYVVEADEIARTINQQAERRQ